MASAALLTIQAQAAQTIEFSMVKSNSIIGSKNTAKTNCPFDPHAFVIDHSFGNVENLEVLVWGLPKNTDFVIFNIQVPNAPFGIAWYNGDILTDGTGVGVTNIVGRFSKGTFAVSLQALDSPKQFPDNDGGAKFSPVQIYHLGIWFNDPTDATKAGCTNVKTTPFTSNHQAGPQVLNTGGYPDNAGPLLQIQ